MAVSLVLLTLAIVGTLDAAYLSYSYLFGAAACAPGSGCGAVMASPYARLLGVPLSTYGLGLYLAIAVSSWQSMRPLDRGSSLGWVSFLALVGNLPTLFLLYLQAVEIGAWCPFCMVSTFIMAMIFVIAVRERFRCGSLRPFVALSRSRDVVPVLLTLVIPPLAFVPLQIGVSGEGAGTVAPTAAVVARIGDREITIDEMDLGIQLRVYSERMTLRMEWLDREVLRTEADARGISVQDLVKQDVYSKIEINQEDIDRRWEQIKDRFPESVTKESVVGKIRNELSQRKSEPAVKDYAIQMRERYGTEFMPPVSERIAIDPNPRGGPEKGSPDASVTIIEFSDLECSYCSRAHSRMASLLRQRPDDVRVIFRHFPLEMHENARHAANVAACAQQQGKFWELANILFSNQRNLDKDQVDRYALRAGLDVPRLNACVESGEGSRIVEADIAEGDALGVTSTPSFFVNGQYVGSLPDGDGLEKLIEREVARGRTIAD